MIKQPVLPDPATEFGQTVRARLRDEAVIWLTTVNRGGTPQPNPVWFLWQTGQDEPGRGEGSFLIYHLGTAARLRTLVERPRVSLNFNSVNGGGITVFTGDIEILEGYPPAHEVPAYAAKYGPRAAGRGGLADFMAPYSVASRVRPGKVRGF